MTDSAPIRTFLAVYPDGETLIRLTELIERLRRERREVRWSQEHQLHFTLRFFGDLTSEQRARVEEILQAVAPKQIPFSVPLTGIGAFPDWIRPRVIWVGAGRGKERLEDLARELEKRFVGAGFPRADRPFAPHLTIGRLREGERLLPPAVAALQKDPIATPPMVIDEMRLMASGLGKGGATHLPLAGFRFGP